MEVSNGAHPPRVLILPKNAAPGACVCTLAHPRTLTPSRYYFDPDKGLYEFTRIAAPKSACRSWLIGRWTRLVIQKDDPPLGKAPTPAEKSKPVLAEADDRPISDGYTVKNAEMLIATPIDPLFLLLPSFVYESSAKSPTSERLFLSADDLLEKFSEKSKHFSHISDHGLIRLSVEQRMRAVCNTVDAGDEEMYRLSDEKLLHELMQKARTMVAKGLPASMEEQFIRKTLEAPVMVVRHDETSVSEATVSRNKTPTSESTSSEAFDSQTSTGSSDSVVSAFSMATETTPPENITPAIKASELYHLLRLRTALSYIMSNYVPPAIAKTLNTLILSGKSQVDFRLLDEYLTGIAKMRAEALASRSIGDFSRKRSMYEDDHAAETRAEKNRKKEEEDKRKKAGESRGVKDLKKVDTKGMKKMSDFFGKAAAAKKK
ncbi:ribonuclease H2, subunit B [Usnea florida]